MTHGEGAISELKLQHALDRARCRGTPKLRVQLLLAATAINLKRLLSRPSAADNGRAGNYEATVRRGAPSVTADIRLESTIADTFTDRPTRRVSLAARLLVALMRTVPTLFTLSLLLLGGLWVADGRTTAGFVMIAAAAGAMAFGLQISVASRLAASSRSIGGDSADALARIPARPDVNRRGHDSVQRRTKQSRHTEARE